MVEKSTPAIFLGGPLNGRVENLHFGTEPFDAQGTIYLHMKVIHHRKSSQVTIHVYCADFLFGSDKTDAFEAAWDDLAKSGGLDSFL